MTTFENGRWPGQPEGRQFVARMLEHHGVAALAWRDGELIWANRVAHDLVAGHHPPTTESAELDRLRRAMPSGPPAPHLPAGGETVVDLELATSRALLTVSAHVARSPEDEHDEVLVTFRAPLETSVDPAQVTRLEAMLDSASDIITVVDRDGRIRFSNPAAGHITGLAGAEANGASIASFVHPEDQPAALDGFQRGVLEGLPVDPLVLRIRMASGTWRHMEVVLAGPVDVDGDVGHVVSLRDVTDRVRRDAEARAHRERLESLVENIDDVIVILDSRLTVRWTTPNIEHLVDGPAYTNVGQHALEDVHPDDVAAARAAIVEAMDVPDGRSRVTVRIHHEQRGWRWVEAGVVNRLDDPAVEGLVCTLRDVTDRYDEAGELTRLRAQDREELQRLRETDRLKDRFLATVSHELRTPLTAVRGFGLVLQQQWDDLADDARRQLLERIVANAASMETMVEQLLDLSRLQAGRVEVELVPLDVDALVAEMVESLAHHLRDHEVAVRPSGLRLLGDRHAFDHVLRNLLTNAARYSHPGTRIEVDAERVGDTVAVHVRDRGIGIAAEDQRRVFQSFYRSAPGLHDQRGAGVGLNIARRYAQLQGGTLDLVSEPGAGSTFTLRLPAS